MQLLTAVTPQSAHQKMRLGVASDLDTGNLSQGRGSEIRERI
jgi:hypothetical protein